MKNLINLSGGDRLNLRVEGKILISESVKNGKTRQTQKEFAGADEAQKACVKKKWESLKKGYVLQNAGAKAGETSLHVYIAVAVTRARWHLRAREISFSSINAAAIKRAARWMIFSSGWTRVAP